MCLTLMWISLELALWLQGLSNNFHECLEAGIGLPFGRQEKCFPYFFTFTVMICWMWTTFSPTSAYVVWLTRLVVKVLMIHAISFACQGCKCWESSKSPFGSSFGELCSSSWGATFRRCNWVWTYCRRRSFGDSQWAHHPHWKCAYGCPAWMGHR